MMTREEALKELKFMQTSVHMDTWSRDAVTWAIAALETCARLLPLLKEAEDVYENRSRDTLECVQQAIGILEDSKKEQS